MLEVTDIGVEGKSWLVMDTEDEGVAQVALAKHIVDTLGFDEDSVEILQGLVTVADITFRRDWAWESRDPGHIYGEAGVDMDEAWLRYGEYLPDDNARFPRFSGFLYEL